MRLCLLPLLLLTFLCTSARAQKVGNDYAFLFYTADYTNGWTDLPETKAKLPELAAELKNNYNFKVETYGDLNLAKLKARLAEINNRPFGPNDQVLFFFTGHGYYQPGSDNGYLIPSDGPHNWNYGDGWLSYDKLRDYLSGNRAQHVLVAFDACYSGSFGRRTMGKPGPPPWDRDADCNTINRSSLRYKSRLFFSSGNKNERVPAQSEFLRRWLQCLRDQPRKNGYVITDDELRGYVNSVTSSSPEDGYFQGHMPSGKFVFIHKNACKEEVDPLKAADDAHWAGVQRAPTALNAKEHLAIFKNCDHYQSALSLLSEVKIDPPTPSPPVTNRTVLPEGMVVVPGGTFQLGDTYGMGRSDERPVHAVRVAPFQMGVYEVTFQEYDRFTKATGKVPAEDVWGRGRQPVINVSWFDAISYCNWLSAEEGFSPVYSLKDGQRQFDWQARNYGLLMMDNEAVDVDWSADGYRLPTEAEWEFAASYLNGKRKARFGNGKAVLRPSDAKFNTADDLKAALKETGKDQGKTLIVGSLDSPNKLGIHDLAGNVAEWSSDWYGEYAYANPTDADNPTGPTEGKDRVYRGGGWDVKPAECRATARSAFWPRLRHAGVGFRLVRSPK